MTGGIIVVQGDVGNNAGCGMKGEWSSLKALSNTPQGTQLRPLTSKELKDINSMIENHGMTLSNDAFCLESNNSIEYHIDGSTVSSGDLSELLSHRWMKHH